MSDAIRSSVEAHYSKKKFIDKILSALENHGFDTKALDPENLETFDEFHIRGREATDEMIELAGLVDGMEILDVGCGIGGPARVLADARDCHVTGIDLTKDFITAAVELSKRCGMDEQNTFVCGSATEMPFDDGEFELVWLQHVNMNIQDKKRLFSECHRVLRKGGKLAVYEVFGEDSSALEYPVPWADKAEISFLESADSVRKIITEVGFSESSWKDVTKQSAEWFAQMVSAPAPVTPKLTLSLISGSDFKEKAINLLAALKDGRVTVGQGLYRK